MHPVAIAKLQKFQENNLLKWNELKMRFFLQCDWGGSVKARVPR